MAETQAQLEKARPVADRALTWGTRLSALAGQIQSHWSSLQAGQRRWLLISIFLLLALFAGLLWFGLKTDWRTLYTGLDPEDARQTGLALAQAQIPFQVTTMGSTILVPATQLDKARLATAAKGSLKSGRLGFELFDKPNWMGSEFDERVNYQRALEGELEHTVGTLADIESARVHLVLPHESLFRDQERPAKASVTLKLRHGSLADGEDEAVRNLIASSVDGLGADRVVLVDAEGRIPLGPKTSEALRLSAEQVLEEKLISTLEPVTGAGNVRASVTLDYDRAASEETEETYDPNQTATLSMQRTEQTSGAQPVAAGVPGTASNAPNAQSLPVYPKQSVAPESSKSESGTYGVSKSVRHLIQNPGRIRRLSAAIVVNDRLLRPASKGSAAQWQPWSPDALHHLTFLAQAAVGFDGSRGDVLSIEDLAFDGNRAPTQVSLPRQVLSTTENSPVLVKYVALLVGLLVIVAFGLRPAIRLSGQPRDAAVRKDSRYAPGHLKGEGAKQPVLAAPEPPPPDPERVRAQEIFDQVTGHLKREPTQSSRLLQSWIHSE